MPSEPAANEQGGKGLALQQNVDCQRPAHPRAQGTTTLFKLCFLRTLTTIQSLRRLGQEDEFSFDEFESNLEQYDTLIQKQSQYPGLDLHLGLPYPQPKCGS